MPLMPHPVVHELVHNQKRLAHYQALRERALQEAELAKPTRSTKAPAAPKALEKWVELYAERVKKLERQAQKQGLRVELGAHGSATQRHG